MVYTKKKYNTNDLETVYITYDNPGITELKKTTVLFLRCITMQVTLFDIIYDVM